MQRKAEQMRKRAKRKGDQVGTKESVGSWVGTKQSVGTRGRFLEQSAVVCGHWLLQFLGD